MRRLLWIFAAVAAGLLCGCSKEGPTSGNDGAIVLAPVMDESEIPTRALLYDDEEALRADRFHTYAYISSTATRYFDSDVKYFTNDVDQSKHRWLFADGDKDVNYFWPIDTSLDFFACAPSSCGYVEVNAQSNPPTFTATMPRTNTDSNPNQEDMKEFMYAHTPAWKKSNGEVPLQFKHPFAAIKFKVSQSHRDLTVRTITINGIEYTGTFDVLNSTWSFGENGNTVLTVNKIIPGQVNFGGELCGPYLMLPQVNSGDSNKKTVEIVFHWNGNPDTNWTTVDEPNKIYKIEGSIKNDWEASKVYTYTVDLGNSREEILFEVSVADWDHIYDHEFDIE